MREAIKKEERRRKLKLTNPCPPNTDAVASDPGGALK